MTLKFNNTFSLSKLSLALILFYSCQACGDEDTGVDPVGSEEGYATGKVTDTNGNPIAGASISIDNTMFYNSNIITMTNTNGTYKEKLATVGTYNVTATLTKELNGKLYTLDLHPEKYEIMSNAGGVRNFQLKLTGRKADGLGYYGATVGINAAVGSYIYDSENIEFTLEPVGKLIDGSTGKTLVMSRYPFGSLPYQGDVH